MQVVYAPSPDPRDQKHEAPVIQHHSVFLSIGFVLTYNKSRPPTTVLQGGNCNVSEWWSTLNVFLEVKHFLKMGIRLAYWLKTQENWLRIW